MSETRTRRRLLGLPITVWVITAITLLGAVALAAFFGSSLVTGSVDTATVKVYLTAPDPTTDNVDCTVTRSGQTTLNVAWSDALPGETCTITYQAIADPANVGPVEVDLATFPNITDGEVAATFGADCGKVITTSATPVNLTLTITDQAIESASYDLTGGVISYPLSGQESGTCS
jgi:hypothetical protein